MARAGRSAPRGDGAPGRPEPTGDAGMLEGEN